MAKTHLSELRSVKKICGQCGTEFSTCLSKVAAGKGKFCSVVCCAKFKTGKIAGPRLKPRKDKKPRSPRVCKECGKTFEVTQAQANLGNGIFCSHQCLGRHNGKNRGRPPVEKECVVCGNGFVTRLDEIEAGRGLYCSVKCYGAARTADKQSLLKSRPFVCKCCGKVFVEKSRAGRIRQFCSNACHGKALRKSKKAPGKRRWKDKLWSAAVILRDKQCIRCGSKENLQAHHIKPFTNNPESRHEISNGATLCPYCHHAQHPTFPLETFVSNGGKSVKYCPVCESPFIQNNKTQRFCSHRCSAKLSHQQRKVRGSTNG